MLKKLVYIPACLALLAAAAVLPAAAEDLTIVSKVTSGKKGKAVTATQYMTANRLRTSDGRGERARVPTSGAGGGRALDRARLCRRRCR